MARGWPESASKKRKRAHRTSPIHSDALATCSPLAASRHRRGTTEAAAAPRAARATRDTASEAAPVRSVTCGPRSSGMYMIRKAADR